VVEVELLGHGQGRWPNRNINTQAAKNNYTDPRQIHRDPTITNNSSEGNTLSPWSIRVVEDKRRELHRDLHCRNHPPTHTVATCEASQICSWRNESYEAAPVLCGEGKSTQHSEGEIAVHGIRGEGKSTQNNEGEIAAPVICGEGKSTQNSEGEIAVPVIRGKGKSTQNSKGEIAALVIRGEGKSTQNKREIEGEKPKDLTIGAGIEPHQNKGGGICEEAAKGGICWEKPARGGVRWEKPARGGVR
jgi:hypothetical protein